MRTIVLRGLQVTAVMNSGAALAGLAAPTTLSTLLYARDVTADPLLLRLHVVFWLFVLALGLGYGLAARSMARGGEERGLLVAGGLGKLAAAALWLEMFLSGHATPWVLAGISFDGALGVLFVLYALRPTTRP
jgi:hypothetical protein